jgi:ferredoxin
VLRDSTSGHPARPPAAAAVKASSRLRVDPVASDGRGLCAEVLPELITLDDWGYPIVGDRELTGRLRREAREAIRLCPKLALRLEDRPGSDCRPGPAWLCGTKVQRTGPYVSSGGRPDRAT